MPVQKWDQYVDEQIYHVLFELLTSKMKAAQQELK